jgi:5'-nucleotidase
MTGPSRPRTDGLDWAGVDHVLLDMDGTILDRHFDDFFFEDGLPHRYAQHCNLPFAEAKQRLMDMYRAVEGTLDWADLEYWTRTLDLDVMALTREFQHLIAYLPDAVEFLEVLRGRGMPATVVTNAHPGGVAVKMARTGLDRHVGRIVGAFDLGCLKMNPAFWPACQKILEFDPARTLYVDDDEQCLRAANNYGIRFVYHSARASTQSPPEPSSRFPSIQTFRDLMGT